MATVFIILSSNTLTLYKIVPMGHRSGRLGGYGKPELPKVLDLPARSRFGEGRAETFDRIILMAPKGWLSFVRFLHFHKIK
jgi:hypothetical protein